jgi:hypothetical protein
MGDVLPAGALEALKEGGTPAFDAVVSADRAQTQAALNNPKPSLAQNRYNEQALKQEHDTIREGHILRGLRENPGRTRAEIEKAFDAEVAAERARRGAHAEAATPIITEGPFSNLLDQPIEDVRAFLGTTRPELPQDYVEMWDESMEREFLTFAANNGMKAQTIQRIENWYAETSIVRAGGDVQEAIKDFHNTFKSSVPQGVREKLVEFFLTDLIGGNEPSV